MVFFPQMPISCQKVNQKIEMQWAHLITLNSLKVWHEKNLNKVCAIVSHKLVTEGASISMHDPESPGVWFNLLFPN